jgi:hypothetical protein
LEASFAGKESKLMCNIIDRIESYEIDLEQLQQALQKRPGKPAGRWSTPSITLLVLGIVEDEWQRRAAAPSSPQGTTDA